MKQCLEFLEEMVEGNCRGFGKLNIWNNLRKNGEETLPCKIIIEIISNIMNYYYT